MGRWCSRRSGSPSYLELGSADPAARDLARRGVWRGGGGGARKPICPMPLSLAAVPGGGSARGVPYLPRRGGGGGASTAQNDPHVAQTILTTHMWGGNLRSKKTFSGRNLCSGAFSATIRCYTKQKARHGSPFLQPPPPPLSAGVRATPPPPTHRRASSGSPLGNRHGPGDIVPFGDRPFEGGAVIAPFLSVFECCAAPLCPFDLLHPKLRNDECGTH